MTFKQATVTEAGFTYTVIQYARLQGWRVCHFRPAMTSKGWRTAVQGDGKGFPDLVLCRRGVLIFAELKVGSRKLTVEQQYWLGALAMTGHLATVWYPDQWDEIERVLA